MRPVNEMRMQARAKLGRALAAQERQTVIGPGKGKKADGKTMSRLGTSFRALLKPIGLGKNRAQEAQRIGSMPDNELEKKFADFLDGAAILMPHRRRFL